MDISENKLFMAMKGIGVDVEGTLSRFVDNDELYTKFLLRFPDEDRMTPVRDAIAEKNYEKLLAAAHKLKGSSANLGMTRLSEKAAVIVRKVRAEEYTGFEADADAVSEEYELVCRTINENRD